MNLHTRLSAVQREHGRRCSACGGPIVPVTPPRPKTWRSVMKDLSDLPDEENIALHAHYKTLHKLPPALQEMAHRMYCEQQGIPYVNQGSVYSSSNPPPAPWYPEEDIPVPKVKYSGRW